MSRCRLRLRNQRRFTKDFSYCIFIIWLQSYTILDEVRENSAGNRKKEHENSGIMFFLITFADTNRIIEDVSTSVEAFDLILKNHISHIIYV